MPLNVIFNHHTYYVTFSHSITILTVTCIVTTISTDCYTVVQGNVIEAGSTTLDAASRPPPPQPSPAPNPNPEAAPGAEQAAHGPLHAVQDTGAAILLLHHTCIHRVTVDCRWPSFFFFFFAQQRAL